LAAQSDDPRHQFALPVIHAALFYGNALLGKAGLQPPTTLAAMKAMVQPLKAIGAVPLVHPAREVSWVLQRCFIQGLTVGALRD
jgi:ABC-type glycerol-3-phosphate transport system substrate-binding protein